MAISGRRTASVCLTGDFIVSKLLEKNQSNLCMYGVDGFGQFVDLVALMFGDGFLPLSNSCRRLRDSFGKALTVLNVHHAGFI